MKDKVLLEVQKILREQLSPQDILKAVQEQSGLLPFGLKDLDPKQTGLSPENLLLDSRMINIDTSNYPVIEVERIYFTIPEIREKKLKRTPFSKGLHSSLFVIKGSGPTLTLHHTKGYDKELDTETDHFAITNSSYSLEKVNVERSS